MNTNAVPQKRSIERLNTNNNNVVNDRNIVNTKKLVIDDKIVSSKPTSIVANGFDEIEYYNVKTTPFTVDLDTSLTEDFYAFLRKYSERFEDKKLLIDRMRFKVGEIFDYLILQLHKSLEMDASGVRNEMLRDKLIHAPRCRKSTRKNIRIRSRCQLEEAQSMISERFNVRITFSDIVSTMIRIAIEADDLNILDHIHKRN